jgi:hypothetical protein
MVFGVAAFALTSTGLNRSDATSSRFLPEYGPAVAGRGAISGRRLAGRIGATDIPPWGSARVRVVVAGAVDAVTELRIGVILAIADPGRAGIFLEANAFFWAIMVSLSEDFGGPPIVLFERPRPGRATGSALFGELGLLGSRAGSMLGWSLILAVGVMSRLLNIVCLWRRVRGGARLRRRW